MKYKGKKSTMVWNPVCIFSKNGDDFYGQGLFKSKSDAMELIKDWVHKVTYYNPDAFKVIMDDESAVVINKRTDEKLYDFRMFPMALFA